MLKKIIWACVREFNDKIYLYYISRCQSLLEDYLKSLYDITLLNIKVVRKFYDKGK